MIKGNAIYITWETTVGANVYDGLFTEASDTEGILDYLTENGFEE